MYLKSLELFGFKSFAERTTIKLDKGICCVVGPNGCGKSNIVDSIRWVLGEQSIKELRGQRMEDIIFSGTEVTPQSGFAEVSITFAETEGYLTLGVSECTITRRLTRAGESTYLINGEESRLKDITELFMDTGIGKTAYSILGQGKIALIISNKPEERRVIFEEAAGITRFKNRKKEALSELKRTEDNLIRVNDILHEVERQKNNLEKQAEKAQQYKKIETDRKNTDLELNYIRYRHISDRIEQLNSRIQKKYDQKRKTDEKITSIEDAMASENNSIKQLETAQLQLNKKIYELSHKIDTLHERMAVNQERRRDLENNIQRVEKNIAQYNQKLKQNAECAQRSNNELDICRKATENRKTTYQELENKFVTSQKHTEEKVAFIDQAQKEIHATEKEVQQLRLDVKKVVDELLIAIDEKKKELDQKETNKADRKVAIISRMDSILEQCRQKNEALDLTQELEGLKTTFIEYADLTEAFDQILLSKGGIYSRKETLDNTIQEKLEAIQLNNSKIADAQQIISTEQKNRDSYRDRITQIKVELAGFESQISRHENELKRLEEERQEGERNLQEDNDRLHSFHDAIKTLDHDVQSQEQESNQQKKEKEKRAAELESKEKELQKLNEGVESSAGDIKEYVNKAQKLSNEITDLETRHAREEVQLNGIKEYILDNYDFLPEDFEDHFVEINVRSESALREELAALKQAIKDLGFVNSMAIEEFEAAKDRYEFQVSQRDDFLKAKRDTEKIIQDIDREQVELFNKTFTQIKQNFHHLFRRLFSGGSADIQLLDTENVLDSGIEIIVQPPGKKVKNICMLSGGERTMTAIAMLFATYMVKASPFYLLDEIDADLDDSNIGRFLNVLKDYQHTQFLIITHNPNTMEASETMYGIVMLRPGISEILSVKFGNKQLVNDDTYSEVVNISHSSQMNPRDSDTGQSDVDPTDSDEDDRG